MTEYNISEQTKNDLEALAIVTNQSEEALIEEGVEHLMNVYGKQVLRQQAQLAAMGDGADEE